MHPKVILYNPELMYRLIFFVFCFVIARGLNAQKYGADINIYTIEDGLLERHVKGIFEDDQGLLWLIFETGIQKFDGTSFKTLYRNTEDEILSDVVNIFQDKDGWLWLNNYVKNTIVFINPYTDEILSLEERFGNAYPIEDYKYYGYAQWDFNFNSKEKLVFLVKKPHRLVYYDYNNGFKVYPFKAKEDLNIRLEFIDEYDNIWVTEIVSSIKNGQIWHVLYPDGSTLFTFNQFDKINLYDLSEEKKEMVEKGIERINKTQEPSKIYAGKKWELDDEGWKIFEAENQEKPILTLDRNEYNKSVFFHPNHEDRENRLWITSNWGLASIRISQNKFTKIFSFEKDTEKPIGNEARGMLIDSGYLYVNFEFSGTVRFDLENYSNWELLSDRSVDFKGRPILKTSKGSIMTGHTPNTLKEYDAGFNLRNTYTLNPNDPGNHGFEVWSLYEDKNKTIWLGLEGGVAYKAENDVSVNYIFNDFNWDKGYTLRYITSMIPATNDLIWLCGGSVLHLFDINKKQYVAIYGNQQKGDFYLPANTFHYVHIDKDSIHWIGSKSGLLRWDIEKEEKRLFTTYDGLSNNEIYSVLEDDYGYLWLATNYGLIRFNKTTFEAENFLEADGISNNEFNRGSYYKSKDGAMYFGGLNGVTVFHPKDFVDGLSFYNRALIITKFQTFNNREKRLIDKTQFLKKNLKIDFRPSDRFFKLDFALINYDEAKRNRYAYKIDGLFDDWIFQKENTIQLGNFDYGEYLFRIKGQDHYGNWSKDELEIPLTIHKPYYLQSWFFLLCGLLLLCSFYLFQRVRHYTLIQNEEKLKNEIKKATSKIGKQAKDLRELNEVKTRFFTNINHELRTPLTLMLVPLDILLDKVSDQSLVKMIKVVKRNAQRQLLLVNQMLDLSKLEIGKTQLLAKKADIISLFKGVFYSYESHATTKNITLKYASEVSFLLLYFDKEKVEKILYNILSNAYKFTPNDGTIEAVIEKSENDVAIRITDSGIGIDPSKLPHIFDRFYQIKSEKSEYQGSGIGLSLVKELIELHNGSIYVKSAPGKGTEVSLLFPLGKEHLMPEQITTDEYSYREKSTSSLFLEELQGEDSSLELTKIGAESKMSILIIEDNEDVRSLIAQLFLSDYNIILATDGEKGIQKAKEHMPDLIISDVMMPKKDGFEVCHVLKNDIHTSHIPILLLTAKATHNEKMKGLRTGADDYLIKPFDSREIQIRVQNLMEGRIALRKKYSVSIALKPSEITNNSIDQKFLEDALFIVEDNLDNEQFSIDVLASQLAMSRPNLNRKLRALANQSSNQFIQSIRLHRAKDLLVKKAGNVAEIAFKTGFSSTSYFVKCYKDQFGETPGRILFDISNSDLSGKI